jgi:hypothetical protein
LSRSARKRPAGPPPRIAVLIRVEEGCVAGKIAQTYTGRQA